MSRFYGSLKGSARTSATRQGTANTGITGHVRGWDIGVEVEARDEDGQDVFSIFKTLGSNGSRHDRTHLGTVRLDLDGFPMFTPVA